MKLNKLLEKVDCISVIGDMETEISSVEYDSRKVKDGSLFICLKGFQSDGHDYAQIAVEQGAAALLVETLPDFETDAVVIQVRNTRKAMAYLSATWFDNPASKMTVIGLTGTKGKTTTSFMIKKILEEAGHKVGLIGTTGAYIGSEKIEIKNTTPESFELHSLFDAMVKGGCDHVVMEASSQGFKLDRTAGIFFDYGAFLNISPDHISPGEHQDFEEYLHCKMQLFTQCGKAVVNKDSEHWAEVSRDAKDPVTISTKQDADYRAYNIHNVWESGILGSAFKVRGMYDGEVTLSMPGIFNVENALVSMAIARLMGIEFDVILKALRNVMVKGRAQILPVPSQMGIYMIDYAHNALSMGAILEMLCEYHPGRLICMFGGGGNRPKQRRYDMGFIAGKYADLTIITTDNPRFESPQVINEHIIEGLDANHGEYKIIMDRAEAIRYLMDHTGPKDIVVFIGKGHEEYQDIRGVKYYFSEEEIVRDYLKEKNI